MTDGTPISGKPAADALDGSEIFGGRQGVDDVKITTQQVKDFAGVSLRTVIADDEDVTLAPFAGTTVVLYTALTAPRTVTLPAASGQTQIVIVKDAGQQVTEGVTIGISTVGGDSIESNQIDVTGGVIEYASDGVNRWASFDSPEAVTAFANQFLPLLALLGVTDGDGNVYSIEYDADAKTLSLKCVTASGTTSAVSVTGAGSVAFTSDDGAGNVTQFSAIPSLVALAVLGPGPSLVGSLSIANPGGVKINNITIDPEQPWPGG